MSMSVAANVNTPNASENAYLHASEMSALNRKAPTANEGLPPSSVDGAPKTYSMTATSNVEASATASVDGLPAGLTQEKYEQALDFGKLAADAYDWDDWAAADVGMGLFTGINDIKNVDFSFDNYTQVDQEGGYIDWWGSEGLDYKVFENNDTGDLVVAYKGTEPLSPVDWVEDAEQAFGTSEQYEQAVNFSRDLKAKVDQYNLDNNLTGDDAKQLYFTGHSLGGGLATASGLATGCETIAFDAAGVSDNTIDALGLDVNNADKITNFNVQGDWLSDHNKEMDESTLFSDFIGLVPTNKQYGEQIWLEGINDQADFGGWLVPEWTPGVDLAESVLDHAWHVYQYQLENKNFV